VAVRDVCQSHCLEVQSASLHILQVDGFNAGEFGHFFHYEPVMFALVIEPRFFIVLDHKVVLVVEFPRVCRMAFWDILADYLSISAKYGPGHPSLELEGCHLCT